MKPVRGTVIKSGASREKRELAKELRRDMTPGEAILWNALRRNQLNGFHFRRQQVILGYIVDFYCHTAALVVEVDGDVHDYQAESDAERDCALAAKGYSVLRVKDEQVKQNLPDVLNRILHTLRHSEAG